MPCSFLRSATVSGPLGITSHLMSRKRVSLLWLCIVASVAACYNVTAAAVNPRGWPNCIALAAAPASDAEHQTGTSRVDIPADSLGCRLIIATSSDATALAASKGPGPTVVQLSEYALVAGQYNGSLGRSPAVQISQYAAGKLAEAVAVIPEGGTLIMQDLLLTDATLTDTQSGKPNLVLLPTNFDMPATATLKLRDVMLVVSQQQLQQYIGYMLGVAAAPFITDEVSFLHIRNYTNPPFGVVEARCITLIAPSGARIGGVPLPILQAEPTSAASAQAAGDAAGVVTVTDSYVLAATNHTLIPLMQRLAGKEDSQHPLFVNLATNMTLSPTIWGSAWPRGSVQIRRPVVWAGSSWRNTSLDFGMDVGQIVLDYQYSNMTIMNVDLENLAYGNEASAADAEGNSILLSNQLWAFKYKRSVPRLVLFDLVLVLPEQKQIDSVIYWVNAFSSDLPFWQQQTTFLRDTLKYTVIQYTVGKVPGEYIIIKALKKDQRMYNLTYTTTPRVAPKVPLPFNASIHQQLVEGQAEPVVGTILTVRGLAVTIWNQRRAACSRPHVLIPSPDPTSGTSWVSWAPAELDVAGTDTSEGSDSSVRSVEVNNPRGGLPPGQDVRANTTLLEPFPSNSGGAAQASAANGTTPDDFLSPLWPPPGGEVIRCPLTIRGPSPNQSTLIDIGFSRDLFKIEKPAYASLANAGPQGLAAAAAASVQANSAPQGLLQLRQLTFMGLPQGADSLIADQTVAQAAAPAVDSGAGSAAAAAPGGGGESPDSDAAWVSGWVSNLPAECWTHLLWFIDRPLSSNISVNLTNITIMLPSPEAQQLTEAAKSAYTAAGGNPATAVLSLLYPTKNGPLRVTYRSISMNRSAAPSSGGRRLLQPLNSTAAGFDGSTANAHICVDSMVGLGLVGLNICFVEAQAGTVSSLPPGYVWATGGHGGVVMWPQWTTAAVISAIVLLLLAATAVAAVVIRRRKRARQQQLLKVVAGANAKSVDDVPGMGADQNYRGAAAAAAVAAAAAAAAAAGAHDNTADSTKSHSSSLAHMLGQCCPGSSADTADHTADAGGASNSSNLVVHTPQLTAKALAGTAAAAAGLTAATAAVPPNNRSAVNDGSQVVASVSQLPAQQKSLMMDATQQSTLCGSLHKPGDGSSLVVNLGEQLGQIAAIHQRSLLYQDLDRRIFNSQCATLGEGETTTDQRMQALSQYQQQQQQQQRGTLIISEDAPASTLQRLTNAISAVSAEMQLRKLGAVSTAAAAVSSPSLSPQMSGASAAVSAAAARAAAGSVAGLSSKRHSRTESGSDRGARAGGHEQQQLGVKRSSLPIQEEEQDPAEAAAAGHADLAQPAGSQVRSQSQQPLAAPDTAAAAAAAGIASNITAAAPSSQPRRPMAASSSNLSNKSAAVSTKQQRQAAAAGQLQLHEVIGSGTFGVVYRATWRGIPAAVKVMQLSGSVAGCGGLERGITDKQSSRREQMAVMETALAATLTHPNIVQVYTYHIRPLHSVQPSDDDIKASHHGGSSSTSESGDSVVLAATGPKCKGSSSSSGISAVVGYELQLVMEYCALGALRESLDNGFLDDRVTGRSHYLTVLTLALGVARAMHHLHSEGVLHGDLKCGNVLLKMDVVGLDAAGSGGGSGAFFMQGMGRQYREQLTAKIADFGLATRLNDTETHVSGVHRGTLNHMSPELLVHGHASRASDVYAMGILLWEMATGERAFADIPKPMLGAAVVRDHARPEWPDSSSTNQAAASAAFIAGGGRPVTPPVCYRELTAACWSHEPRDRPSFAEVAANLETFVCQEQQRLASLAALAEARSAAQTAAAAATGYAARKSADLALQRPAGAAAAAAMGPSEQQPHAAAEHPAAAAGGGADLTVDPTTTAYQTLSTSSALSQVSRSTL